MNALSSEARNTTAPSTSSGNASRRSDRACITAAAWKLVMSGLSCTVSLRIRPGATALTVMPSGPSSRASARVIPMTAAFDVT
jgi:hypothetical protein